MTIEAQVGKPKLYEVLKPTDDILADIIELAWELL